jgi:hypothetical protein
LVKTNRARPLFDLNALFSKTGPIRCDCGIGYPAASAPPNGASQNSYSCCKAQFATTKAGPVLRAGLTERFVIGIPMRCMSVKPSPIAMGAKRLREDAHVNHIGLFL